MSEFDDDVAKLQAYAGVRIDRDFGPITARALCVKLGLDTTGPIIDAADARSEGNIKTLLPQVQPLARKLLRLAAAKGITMVVTSGTRTYAEQDALYEQGRSKPGNIVTNARGGYSAHNFGTGFDLTEFKNGQPVWDSPHYKAVGELGESIGLSWGGHFGDEPHYALRPSWAKALSERDFIAGLRQRKQDGRDLFA